LPIVNSHYEYGSVDPNFTEAEHWANAQPTIGSGNIWYTQAGILLPSKADKPKVRVQPFGALPIKTLML
jgi:hypothetical protein